MSAQPPSGPQPAPIHINLSQVAPPGGITQTPTYTDKAKAIALVVAVIALSIISVAIVGVSLWKWGQGDADAAGLIKIMGGAVLGYLAGAIGAKAL